MSQLFHVRQRLGLVTKSAGIILSAILIAGCGGSQDGPMSAEQSGLRPAGEETSPTGSDPDGNPQAPPESAGGPVVDGPPNGELPPIPPMKDPFLQPSEGRPSGESGDDPFQAPENATPEQLMAYIEKLDLREPQGVTRELQVLDLIKTLEARLKAADRILATPELEPNLRYAAIEARFLSLRTLAQLGDPEQAAALKEYAAQLKVDKDPRVVMLSRLASLQLMLEALTKGQSTDPAPVLAEIKALVADEKVDDQIFWLARDAAMVFQQLGFEEEAIDALTTVGNHFKDSEKEDVAAAAAGALEQAKMVALQPLLFAIIQGEEGSQARLLEKVDEIFATGTPTVTAYQLLVRMAQMLEYSGHVEAARGLLTKLQTVYADHENEQLAKHAAQTTEKALQRLDLIGQPFLVEGVTLDGQKFDWSTYRGKVVLVDFWASWCEPCIKEMPDVERSYEKFREKGFEVVGVNVDDTRQAAQRFLAARPLPWTTVVAEDETQQGVGRDPNTVRYGVDAIPFMVLVDKEGNVAALHVRGEQLDEYLEELLGPPLVPEKVEPTVPAQPPASEQPDLTPLRPDDTGRVDHAAVYFCGLAVAGDDDGQPGDDTEAEAADEAQQQESEINPYTADEGLSSFELVEFLLDMKEKPRVIQSRPGFTEAVTEAADRILAADASDKFKEIAALTKLEYLHKDACLGDEQADEQLMACVAELKDSRREKIAAEVEFLCLERRAVEADQLANEEIAELLADLKEYFTDRELAAKHLRIASGTVRAINQLDDDDQREAHFAEFGKIFAASKDKKLAAYGKNLSKKEGESPTQVVGQTLEISGVTVDGTAFDWSAYRGNHVLVHFWATWCPACVRAMPQIAQLRKEYGDKGFEIVGVCMDQDLDKLAEYLEKNDTPWTHLAGQRCRETAKKYGVRGIPSLMLVDGEAKILAVSHKPTEIGDRLASLLDKPK